MQVEEMKEIIEQGLVDSRVTVEGDGHHFQAVVVSDAFSGKSMVQQHQMVYQTLGDKIGGVIHALSISTYTHEEWQQQKNSGIK